MKPMLLAILTSAILGIASCQDRSKGPDTVNPADTTTPKDTAVWGAFSKGADISWITEQESRGVKFFNKAGVQKDILDVLKEQGMNTVRLRVWVNPPDGWCNKADVMAKARRVKAAGMRLMIDFHYSDTWADPGKQPKPVAWRALDVNGLKAAVYEHTVDVLRALRAEGITPEWVQVGNETNDGMLWEDGRASARMANFAAFVQSGYTAVKAVSPATKVIVHISNGYDNGLFRWIFDGLKANNTQYDVIGMSLYPSVHPTDSSWVRNNQRCLANMNDMVTRYGKPVMVVEVGMRADQPQRCYSFLADLIAKVKAVPGNKGLGVLYWEPQAYNRWKGYDLGAFDNSGKPTRAMDAFRE